MKDPNIKGSSLSPEQIDAVKGIWQNLELVDQNQPEQADGVEVIYPDIPCFAKNVLHANITKAGEIDSKSVLKPIHANNVTFAGFNQQFQLAQAPHTPSDMWRHWHAIFEAGSDVTEIVNPHTSDTHGSSGQLARLFGLNFIHPSLLNKKLNIQIGSHRIESIAEIPHETNRLDSNKYGERRYNLNVVNENTGKLKTINYRLIKADFSNRILKAQHLYRMIKGNHSSTNKPMWISSQCGIGRPSALMMAHTLKQGIEDGKIRADNLVAMDLNVIKLDQIRCEL